MSSLSKDVFSDRPGQQLFALSLTEPNLRPQTPAHNTRSTSSRLNTCFLKLICHLQGSLSRERARSEVGGDPSHSSLQQPSKTRGRGSPDQQTD